MSHFESELGADVLRDQLGRANHEIERLRLQVSEFANGFSAQEQEIIAMRLTQQELITKSEGLEFRLNAYRAERNTMMIEMLERILLETEWEMVAGRYHSAHKNGIEAELVALKGATMFGYGENKTTVPPEHCGEAMEAITVYGQWGAELRRYWWCQTCDREEPRDKESNGKEQT